MGHKKPTTKERKYQYVAPEELTEEELDDMPKFAANEKLFKKEPEDNRVWFTLERTGGSTKVTIKENGVESVLAHDITGIAVAKLQKKILDLLKGK